MTDAIGPFHQGGKEQRYLELAPRLAAEADVHVYTMQWWGGPTVRHVDGVTYHAICPLIPLYSGGRRSIRQALVFAIACLRLLMVPFDVLEADHMPYFPLLTLKLVAVLRRRRLVVTWHEYWGFGYWREYLGMAGLIGGTIEVIAAQLPDAIIAASPQTAERLRPVVRAGVPIVVAPNGVDLSHIDAVERPRDGFDVVTVGRLLPHKRIDLLLEALVLLHRGGCRLTACVIGSGPEWANLIALRDRLGLEPHVRFEPGLRTQAEMLSAVKAAGVAVFPSEREGFGIAVLEALACGVPVLTTSAPDNLARHLVTRSEGAGIVCHPDPSVMADAIVELMSRVPMSGRPSWLVEYDWSEIAESVAGILWKRPVGEPQEHAGDPGLAAASGHS